MLYPLCLVALPWWRLAGGRIVDCAFTIAFNERRVFFRTAKGVSELAGARRVAALVLVVDAALGSSKRRP